MTPPAPLQLPTADEALGLGPGPHGERAGQRARAGRGAARGPARRARGRAAPVGRGDAGAEQRRGDRRAAAPTCTPTSRCGRRARRPRSRSTSSSPSCARTARSTTCSPALDPAGLDPTAARLLEKTLEEFRRAGVDQDDATRARLAEISERITAVDQEFSRNIRDDVRTVKATPEQLAGLPEDWLDAHPADDEGLVTVTTDYPDAVPARMFVQDADVRRQITIAFLERGWPAERAAAQGAVRPAPRVRQPRRLRRLGVVRRRGEDDREGPGDPGVHRPDRAGRAGADGARPGAW